MSWKPAQRCSGYHCDPWVRWVSFCALPVSVLAFSRYSSCFPTSKDMHVRLTGDFKLPIIVSVNMHFCLSLYVVPLIDCQPVQGGLHLLPNDSL